MTHCIHREPGAAAGAPAPAVAGGEKPGWNELPIGGLILEAGNAVQYQTGDWRSQRPVFHAERCIHCLFCWVFCPDSSIIVQDAKVTGFDYFHCKGCGICATECPVKEPKAISMEDESKFEAEEG